MVILNKKPKTKCMNVQFCLIRHPQLLLDLPRLVFLAFEDHMKKSTTFPSIFITDNEELARVGNQRTDLSLVSDFDVVIMLVDSDEGLSDSLSKEIHQTEVRRFGDTLYSVLQAYR